MLFHQAMFTLHQAVHLAIAGHLMLGSFQYYVEVHSVSCLQVDTYWIPLIHQAVPVEDRKPIILVGNKSDILEASSIEVSDIVFF
jgi:hypothetical protein